MAAWGTGIFSNDTACDVRDTYEELICYGRSADEAEQYVIRDLELDPHDPTFDSEAWIALAATEWRCGRKLSDTVKEIALALIDNPVDMDNWKTEKQRNQRYAALASLREKLNSPLPRPKVIKPMKPVYSPWKIGDVIAIKMPIEEQYPSLSDQYALLHLVNIKSNKVSRFAPDTLRYETPYFIPLYWWGDLNSVTPDALKDMEYAIKTVRYREWGKVAQRQHAFLRFDLFESEYQEYAQYYVVCNIEPPDCVSIEEKYGCGQVAGHSTSSAEVQRWLWSSVPCRLF